MLVDVLDRLPREPCRDIKVDYRGLGKRIRYLRRTREITQRTLAQQVGISMSFLGHIERGTRKASIETLIKLAFALETETDLLLQDSFSN